MIVGLSDEDRKKYEGARNEFKKLKGGIEEEIGMLERRIQGHKRYLARIRPVIPDATKECNECGIISMRYLGNFPNWSKPDLEEERVVYTPKEKYECVLCGHREEETLPTD